MCSFAAVSMKYVTQISFWSLKLSSRQCTEKVLRVQWSGEEGGAEALTSTSRNGWSVKSCH